EAAFATVGVHRKVNANDLSRGRDASDERFDFLRGEHVGVLAAVEGAIRRLRAAARARSSAIDAATRAAAGPARSGRTPFAALWRLLLEGPHRNRAAALQRPVEHVTRRLGLCRCGKGHESEAARTTWRPVL